MVMRMMLLYHNIRLHHPLNNWPTALLKKKKVCHHFELRDIADIQLCKDTSLTAPKSECWEATKPWNLITVIIKSNASKSDLIWINELRIFYDFVFGQCNISIWFGKVPENNEQSCYHCFLALFTIVLTHKTMQKHPLGEYRWSGRDRLTQWNTSVYLVTPALGLGKSLKTTIYCLSGFILRLKQLKVWILLT